MPLVFLRLNLHVQCATPDLSQAIILGSNSIAHYYRDSPDEDTVAVFELKLIPDDSSACIGRLLYPLRQTRIHTVFDAAPSFVQPGVRKAGGRGGVRWDQGHP